MVLILKNILEKYFSILGNSVLGYSMEPKIVLARSITKPSQLAGLILADLYDYYEEFKDKELLTEEKFFLNINNPIKHLVNILNNSGFKTTNSIAKMTFSEAIFFEYKLIKEQDDDNNLKFSLFSVVNSVRFDVTSGSMKINTSNREYFINKLQETLDKYKLYGLLDEDTKKFTYHESYGDEIEEIADKLIEKMDLGDIISEIYTRNIEEELFTKESEKLKIEDIEVSLKKMKADITKKMQTQFDIIGAHLDHAAKELFNKIEATASISRKKRYSDVDDY